MDSVSEAPAIKSAVIGAGSFGTALGHLVASKGGVINLWGRNKNTVSDIQQNHRNSAYLAELPLHPKLVATQDLKLAVSDADLVFIAVPSTSFRSVCRLMIPLLPPSARLISTTKGLVEDPDFLLMSQVLEQEVSRANRQHSIGVLSGPNLAREIIENQYSGSVVASADPILCDWVREALSTASFRVYSGTDLYGIELGGALKNIYAIILGMAAGAGLGKNTEGLLLTRSIAEMCRFAYEIKGSPATFLGLAGIGDLFATCTSPLSRNYSLGFEMARGASLERAQKHVEQSAEGINTVRIVRQEAKKRQIAMPLAEALASFLLDSEAVEEVLGSLMASAPGEDIDSSLWQLTLS
ncbi:MAG: NAD(P)H-dependent glycerol-3-phosphate dehydrogenase [Gammaproteobacteria bacterium]